MCGHVEAGRFDKGTGDQGFVLGSVNALIRMLPESPQGGREDLGKGFKAAKDQQQHKVGSDLLVAYVSPLEI